ncbi:transcription termination factor Rho [Enorma burkinafasonensis]|uniref:transcription termination factor Rho n=1 Tax=Enorma burkinafasonensis TaxID=2590867 RepID=UPI0026EAE10A|nr:transcription termination factor Rho [Enorma burkinafasonensis]MCI7730587.1 transcription termination factor Rho [Enorma burkinafasonensis]
MAEENVNVPAEPAAADAVAPRPRRRTRAAKPAGEDAAPAAQAEPAAAERPARARRAATRKKAEPAPAPEVSAEVAQARALAQISQASVVRKQRRAAARAEQALTAPAPAPDAPASSADAEAERPRRRGRKPKAVAEAERAAEQAAAAVAPEASAEPAPEASGSAETDVRPGRTRRAAEGKTRSRSRKAEETAAAPADTVEVRSADAKAAEQPADAKGKGADSHDGQAPEQAAPRRQHGQARREHVAGNQDGRNGDRRNNRQGRKQRNGRYNAPTEPSLTREELAGMKVAELRAKAKEFDLDTTGKKKAELVEEIYTAAARAEGFREIRGILDISNEGFGHIRAHGYMPSREDAFVPANLIRAARLRPGDLIEGTLRPARQGDKFPGLAKIKTVNGLDPEAIRNRPKFSDLTPIYPNELLKMEHGKDSITGRAIDIVSPIGKGQRGLIVSPPKAGKTTILKKICQSIAINNPEVHLICLLVDERPEEVTDMERSIKGDVVASTFDMPADNHTRVSELVIERAKRIVELGGDVVVVLDSITRLARAYNLAAPASGRILSGGVDSAALYPPKRFLGAARNIENGGSLTILASALVDTGSKMDEVIFEEFKGTGNMELKLDRELADRRIFPAIDPVASGTRNEDLLIPEQMRPFVWGIRRVLANMSNTERCASAFIKGLKGTNSNEEFLIRSAKRAQGAGDML